MSSIGVLLVVVVEFIACIEYAYAGKWTFSLAWGCYAVASFALYLAAKGVGV